MFTHSLYLVGMTGSGKTTVGKELAKKLGFPFFDADREIESKSGLSISEIFEYEGETQFRRREAATIDELTQLRKIVLATGGGAILRTNNRKNLSHRGFVVHLNAPIEELIARTENNTARPLLQNRDACEVLSTMYHERNSLYLEVADATFDTELYANVHEAAAEIVRWYNSKV